jgi:hypothetical protein
LAIPGTGGTQTTTKASHHSRCLWACGFRHRRSPPSTRRTARCWSVVDRRHHGARPAASAARGGLSRHRPGQHPGPDPAHDPARRHRLSAVTLRGCAALEAMGGRCRRWRGLARCRSASAAALPARSTAVPIGIDYHCCTACCRCWNRGRRRQSCLASFPSLGGARNLRSCVPTCAPDNFAQRDVTIELDFIGAPYGIRTRVSVLRGPRPSLRSPAGRNLSTHDLQWLLPSATKTMPEREITGERRCTWLMEGTCNLR